MAIISLPALIILGIIVPIIAIREGDYIWGIIGMIIFGGMCSWLTGYSLFWKVVIDHEKVEYHSLFFGSTLLEKDIQCIQGEKYMEKYRKKDVEEEI